MSSIKTFCVRWIALIAVTAGVLVPVSHVTASDRAPRGAATQQATERR